MNDYQLRILVAFDGSEKAMEAVRYIASIFPSRNTEIVLFFVHTKIPQPLMNSNEKSHFQLRGTDIRAFVTTEHKKIHQSFEQAIEILQKAGFPPEAVTVKSQDKQIGIARDIIKESQKGYNAVVVGRTGASKIKDILLGNIPTKLLGKTGNLPLIVVGGESKKNKVLVAFDESREIYRAVNKIGRLLNPENCEVLLCHVLNPQNDRARMESLMQELKDNLCEQDFPSDRIFCEFFTESTSEANCIIDKANNCRFESVVIGRRDLNAIKEFFLGRVGEKVFKQGENLTVWVWS